jgi:hypothetical protein
MSEINQRNSKESKDSNGRGGARKGAGRKAGSATKRTREIADKAAGEGITPLEYMLEVMRTEPGDNLEPRELAIAQTLRFEAAKAAAPYMHPRLAAIEHTGGEGGPIDHSLTVQFVAKQ